MRTDEKLAGGAVRSSPEWERAGPGGDVRPEIDSRLQDGDELVDGELAVHSLSGKERNRLFLNGDAGREFTDLSALSGMDTAADSRGFVLFDYDHDGWQDVALVNANQPLMNLYHNDIAAVTAAGGGAIAIRFVGGNSTAAASEFACRDGYGAVVEVTLAGGVKLVREHRCGEGYAAQNSATLLVGIGDRPGAVSVAVRWPSGRSYAVADVPEGTLLTAYEDRPAGAFTQRVYRDGRSAGAAAAVRRKFPLSVTGAGTVRIFTTTATWCAACRGHLPELALLQQDGVALYGVPIDPDDGADKLGEYVAEHDPPYQMLAGIGAAERRSVTEFLAAELRTENPLLPSTVITDADGNVLEVMAGIPTLSRVRSWLAKP